MTKTTQQNIALIGLGCVGTGFYSLQQKYDSIQVKRIVVKDPKKKREAPAELIQYDYHAVLADPEIDTVVELIDDAEVALDIARKTFKAGKNLVSANKKMIADNLEELLSLARKHQSIFRFEAAVCGSIPILQTVDRYLTGLDIRSVSGILNGSSNYILTKMRQENLDFHSALKLAQNLGFAESDPTLDIGGFDAASKLRILAAFAFGEVLHATDIIQGGISSVEYRDLHYARQRQLRLKLLAFAEPDGLAYVLPAFVGPEHASYGIEQEYNIALVESTQLGEQSYVGKGAGSLPTGKAVLEDVLAVSRAESYGFEVKRTAKEAQKELDVYFRFPNNLPPELNFIQKKEVFKSSLVNYVIGTLNAEELKKAAGYLNRPGYFLAVFPESLKNLEAELIAESCALSL